MRKRVPKIDAPKMQMIPVLKPQKAPMQPINLTSPNPMVSFFKKSSLVMAIHISRDEVINIPVNPLPRLVMFD